MNDTLQNLMREATRLTQSGNLMEATNAIQRALRNSSEMDDSSATRKTYQAKTPAAPAPTQRAPVILDGCVFEVTHARPPETAMSDSAMSDAAETDTAETVTAQPDAAKTVTAGVTQWNATQAQGKFTEGSYTHGSLTRTYKLYTPPDASDIGLPLVVMLHGCTQNPDDFAAGTGMNGRAREQGFYVLYPAQSADANPQRCWNWFKHTHQSRGRGEAALLASMTLSIIERHGIDPRRVYIAGLSAGGAMAAIVAAAYPEIYAAVGVHSGLAVGAASNVSEALAAMKSGAKSLQTPPRNAVPTIVFHGDQDHTVHPRNGEQVSQQVIASVQGAAGGQTITKSSSQGVSSGGRRFTRSEHHSAATGQIVGEHWLVGGAGHAWAGGSTAGSYTDPKGPDATGEMLRFFMAQKQPV